VIAVGLTSAAWLHLSRVSRKKGVAYPLRFEEAGQILNTRIPQSCRHEGRPDVLALPIWVHGQNPQIAMWPLHGFRIGFHKHTIEPRTAQPLPSAD
jgi:hypothetical protein